MVDLYPCRVTCVDSRWHVQPLRQTAPRRGWVTTVVEHLARYGKGKTKEET